MLNLKRKRVKEIALYFFAFVCLSVITFFSEPHIDEHIFSVSTDYNLKSIWDYCVGYGNGRLLGNLFCVFFSHIYWLKFVFVSLCVVGLSAILNKLIFNGNCFTFIPTILLLLIPSNGTFIAIYRYLPCFINYFVPLLMWVMAFFLLKKLEVKEKTGMQYWIILFLMSFLIVSSCLFSENTTVVIAASFVFLFFNGLVFNRKITFLCSVSLLSALLGCMILYFVPIFGGVSEKLDSYRGFTTAIDDIIYNLVHFSDKISSLFFILSLLSISLCYIIVKSQSFSFFNIFKLVILIIYPFISVLDTSLSIERFYIFVMTVGYGLVVMLTVLSIKEKKTRIIAMEICLLLCCSVSSVSVIKLSVDLGNRLNFLNCFLLTVLALYLIKKEVLSNEAIKLDFELKHMLIVVQICIFVFVSGYLTISNVSSFNKYVVCNGEAGAKVVQSENDILFAWLNKNHLDPQKNLTCPREEWLDVLQ